MDNLSLISAVSPYSMLSTIRLQSLLNLSRRICEEDIPGNFVECGVCRGGSAALMAYVIQTYSKRHRLLYAFDTFTGMPAPTNVDQFQGYLANETGFGEGTLQAPLENNLWQVCRDLGVTNVVAVPGLFRDTLPVCGPIIGDIALLHADSDWYESTMDIFNNLYGNIVPGGLVQLDDYNFWEGCAKAVSDFVTQKRLTWTLYSIPEPVIGPKHQISYVGVWFSK